MNEKIRKIATGYTFTEGPVWHPDGYLLFSDTPTNKIYKLTEDGESSVYLDKSGFDGKHPDDLSDQVGSNGLALDAANHLVICQHGNHAVAKLNENNQLETLCNRYGNRLLNSPNDLAIHSAGGIFFSDPPYGLKDQVLNGKFQPHAGIYFFYNNVLTLVSTDYNFPNGLCFSADERYLYAGSNHPDEKKIMEFSLSETGEVESARTILAENTDGMMMSPSGNLFLCADEGIVTMSPDGKHRQVIAIPETPTNITISGTAGQYIFVTARTSIYRIEADDVDMF